MKPYIYVRGIKNVDHTVFAVDEGQKTYYDPRFNRTLPYSSGQQVKRSILAAMLEALGSKPAPITFNYVIKEGKNNNKELTQGEPWSPCDPTLPDQLLGGWMRVPKKADTDKKIKQKDLSLEEIEAGQNLKRRSPFSISALRPLHPLLSGVDHENLTFDRSENPDHNPVIVRDEKGNILTEKEIQEFLTGHGRTISRRNWIPDHKRATGIFVYDIAIDLRRLFCVSKNNHEPEIGVATTEKLKKAGWVESKNYFGECFVMPEAERKKLIDAISEGIFNWQINSNQSRTYSPMETLAVAISDNAHLISNAIRAELPEDSEDRVKAVPVVENADGLDIFYTPNLKSFLNTLPEYDINAYVKAASDLKEKLLAFNYEKQL